MSFESTTPNMSLILPGVGQTLSPTWATDLNNSLTIVDGHNHTPGYGVPVPSSGLNINADLTMANNNLIAIKSLRMQPQSILSSGSDLDCLFVNGVDLYYNDGLGNHVRITQSGGVAGSPGSIANLTSPASATYVAGSQTFVWQSAANTPANMDNASITIRNLVANSFGLTLNPPNSMAANYSITLPTLPVGQQIMTLDAAGNMSAPYTVDNTTIAISANVIGVINIPDNIVTTAKIVNGAVTQAKLAALPFGISSSSGVVATTSTTYSDINNLNVTITTSGRPVFIGLSPDQISPATLQFADNGGYINFVQVTVTTVAEMFMLNDTGGATVSSPPGAFNVIHVPSAGTWTYKAQFKAASGSNVSVQNVRLIAYEL